MTAPKSFVDIAGYRFNGIFLVDAATGLPYVAGGGSGGGDASAANQATQITAEQLTNSLLQGTLTVSSGGFKSKPTVTRPNDTTPYAAGDVVGGAITFASIGPAGGHVMLTSCDLMVALAAVPSGMTSFRLHLYDVTPPSALADNTAWDLPSGDRASYLGYVDMGLPVDLGSTLYVQTDSVNRQSKLAAASTSLFGYLVTTGAYTPTASEVYTPTLRAAAI